MSDQIEICEAESLRELKDFIAFPRLLYKTDPYWAPPIWRDEKKEILSKGQSKNIVLKRSDHALFIARLGGKPAGRIIVYIDPAVTDYYGQALGFFGNFEAADNPQVFEALFSAAEEWMRQRKIKTIRGPINPLAECWGFLLNGFESPPVFMSPYNPPYYNFHIETTGYAKVKDLLVYEASGPAGYTIPERFVRFTETMEHRRPELEVRRIDMKNLMTDAEHIWRILNASVAGNWGFVPVPREEMTGVVKKLKPLLDPDAVLFVENKGIPVACCLGFPDLNIIIKKIRGRLLPFGFIRLLAGIKKVRDYRLWGLAVMPEYSGKGLDVFLYAHLFNVLKPKGVRLEANYILEDNLRIRNALEKLNMKPIKTYRVYEKSI